MLFFQSKSQPQRRGEYNVYSTFQSHEPEFDYLKSLEIEEKINKIRWLPQQNAAYFLLSTNGQSAAAAGHANSRRILGCTPPVNRRSRTSEEERRLPDCRRHAWLPQNCESWAEQMAEGPVAVALRLRHQCSQQKCKIKRGNDLTSAASSSRQWDVTVICVT